MSSLPWKARYFIAFLTACTLVAVLLSLIALTPESTLALTIIFAAIAIAVLDGFPIHRYGDDVEITISNAVKFAIVLLFPVPVVILSTFTGTLIGEVPAKRGWSRKIFNISQMTLTWGFTTWLYSIINFQQVGFFSSLENTLAVMIAGCVSVLVNTIFVSMVISLAAQMSFFYVFTQNTRLGIWQELAIVTLGAFLAILWRFNPPSIVLAGLPLFVVRDSYRIANHLRNQTQDALRALVRVVDERDHHTYNHSENVSEYARGIAQILELGQDEIEVITSAALLHDLGKVGMADDILFNPKLLNPTERKSAETHAEIGAMLLSKFPLFEKGAVLVRHHHEHYDGKGYPDGLEGKLIPIGSRIISVADAYQAMTEDRPYRRALTKEEAIARLIEACGTQFDPDVVRAFAQFLKVTPYQSKGLASATTDSSATNEGGQNE